MKKLILVVTSISALVFANAHASKEKTEKKAPVAGSSSEVKSVKESPRKSASEDDDISKYIPTHFKKGWKVEVTDYDVKADAFEIAVRGEEESGPFYFTPSEVLKGTGTALDLKNFSLQKKKDMVGAEVILKEDMKIMTFEEYIHAGGSPETF